MPQIHAHRLADTPALDGQITALDAEMFRLQENSARLHEARLVAQLQASLPDGGTLVAHTWFDDEEADCGISLFCITDREDRTIPGLGMGGDWERVLGEDVADTLRADVEAIFTARPSRWSGGAAAFTF